jgi:hypothetical protein
MARSTKDPNDIEVGWLIVGRLDRVDRKAVMDARAQFRDALASQFAGFEWRVPLVERKDIGQAIREEPSSLLEYGVTERDGRHWDFVFVITGADLVGHEKRSCVGAPSSALDVAIMSTARIDPQASGEDTGDEKERRRIMAQRILGLSLHLFGHLNGLGHPSEDDEGDPAPGEHTGVEDGDAMRDVTSLDVLDAARGYGREDEGRLRDELADVADLRLEEGARRRWPLSFVLAAMWENRDGIGRAILRTKPWRVPFRLSRLTTAAVSALLLLVHTEEAWAVASRQAPGLLAGLSVASLAVTTWYVVQRQQLLMGRGLTEQTVATRTSVTVATAFGLLTTYLLLFGVTAALGGLLFGGGLVVEWTASAGSSSSPSVAQTYLKLGAFVASLGLAIGALGASFEQGHYFRHVAYIDEET